MQLKDMIAVAEDAMISCNRIGFNYVFDPETALALCRLAESAMKIAPPLTDAGVKLEHARDRLAEILEHKS